MLLTESDRNAIEHECEMMIGKPAFDAIEAAVLEKLCAGVSMPEPASSFHVTPLYEPDQLRAYGAAQRLKALEDAAKYLEDIHPTRLVKFAMTIRALKGEA